MDDWLWIVLIILVVIIIILVGVLIYIFYYRRNIITPPTNLNVVVNISNSNYTANWNHGTGNITRYDWVVTKDGNRINSGTTLGTSVTLGFPPNTGTYTFSVVSVGTTNNVSSPISTNFQIPTTGPVVNGPLVINLNSPTNLNVVANFSDSNPTSIVSNVTSSSGQSIAASSYAPSNSNFTWTATFILPTGFIQSDQVYIVSVQGFANGSSGPVYRQNFNTSPDNGPPVNPPLIITQSANKVTVVANFVTPPDINGVTMGLFIPLNPVPISPSSISSNSSRYIWTGIFTFTMVQGQTYIIRVQGSINGIDGPLYSQTYVAN